MEEWIGVIEASKILGIAPNTVKGLVQKGILPAYEITGVRGYQFKRQDVLAMIKRVEPRQAHSPKPKKKKR